MWKLIYNFKFIPTLIVALFFAKFFNKKIKQGLDGRINLFDELKDKLKNINGKYIIWFHSSSLGEFEQAKPIITSLKNINPDIKIVVTFFSPSGYLHAKNYKLADVISYLPIDTERNAKYFIDLLNPKIAIMIRYDVWPNFTWELKKRNIPQILVNGTLKNNSKRFLPIIKSLHSEIFNSFNKIFTVSENDKVNYEKLNVESSKILANGDTRYDQVVERRELSQKKHLLPSNITIGKTIFIAAQTWSEDDNVICSSLKFLHNHNPNLLTIIVPHEPTEENIERIENEFSDEITTIRFSLLNDFNNEKIIIVDSVGILVPLYKYADFTYVGGSFKQGIHNILEPASFGLPIIFGPNHKNSQEAIELKSLGGAFEIKNSSEFENIFNLLLNNKDEKLKYGNISKLFVENNVGATKRFVNYLLNFINLK